MSEHVYRPQSSQTHSPAAPAISHVAPLGAPVAHAPAPVEAHASKIHGFSGTKVGDTVESRWQRPLNKNGLGATHVRTFTGSLSAQGLEYMDRHINEWLDGHPDAEVKFAQLQIGNMPTATGREPALIAQVWI